MVSDKATVCPHCGNDPHKATDETNVSTPKDNNPKLSVHIAEQQSQKELRHALNVVAQSLLRLHNNQPQTHKRPPQKITNLLRRKKQMAD